MHGMHKVRVRFPFSPLFLMWSMDANFKIYSRLSSKS